jgi:hypothetical protein
MRRLVVVASSAVLLLAWPSYGQQADAFRDTVVAHERAGLDALKVGDIKAFADSTAEDAIFVDSSGIASKAQVVTNVGGFRLTDYTMSDIHFLALSKDSGLVSYRMVESGTSHGHDFTAKVLVSSIWTKRDGKWLCTFSQETATK